MWTNEQEFQDLHSVSPCVCVRVWVSFCMCVCACTFAHLCNDGPSNYPNQQLYNMERRHICHIYCINKKTCYKFRFVWSAFSLNLFKKTNRSLTPILPHLTLPPYPNPPYLTPPILPPPLTPKCNNTRDCTKPRHSKRWKIFDYIFLVFYYKKNLNVHIHTYTLLKCVYSCACVRA